MYEPPIDWLKEAKAAYGKRQWEAAQAAATIALVEKLEFHAIHTDVT